MKSKLITLGILLAAAVLLVIVIWQTSDKPNSKNNGFVRNYIIENLRPSLSVATNSNIKHISGVIGDTVYLSTVTAGEIAWIDLKTRKIQKRMFIKDTVLLKQIKTSNTIRVSRNGILLFDGNSRLVVQVDHNEKLYKIHRLKDLFTRAVPISPYSFAMRKIRPGEHDQSLYRYDMVKDTVMNESTITEPVKDGGLVTSGLLNYDPSTKLCSYVTRYANHIALTDTNMKVVLKGRTIDTTSQYTMKTRKVKESKGYKVTNDGPQRHVNKAACMANGILYVYSYMKADNETTDAFANSNVIDLYDTTALNYLGSYRLPAEGKKRIRHFEIKYGKIYALYSNTLRIYALPTKDIQITN